jgi:hypothetical protein
MSGFGSGSPPTSGGSGAGGTRGQGGGNRDSYRLPNEGLSQARFAADADREAAGDARPSIVERFKRWFSSRF